MKKLLVIVSVAAAATAAAGYAYFHDKRSEAAAGSSQARAVAPDTASDNLAEPPYMLSAEGIKWAKGHFQKNGNREPARIYLQGLKNDISIDPRRNFLGDVLDYYPKYGMDERELDAFFEGLPQPLDPQLMTIYRGWQNQVKLRSTPFKLSATTLQGQHFDIADLRGKIVLVDVWDTGCSACIRAMPTINSALLKYKQRGFEVVSLPVRDTTGKFDIAEIERIKKEKGLDWITLNGADKWSNLAATYGLTGRPQYFLLDRQGRLIAGTGRVDLGKGLNELLEKHL